MNKFDDGGTAFPTSVSADSCGGLNYGDSGMSLRDWFAAMALQGVVVDRGTWSIPTDADTERIAANRAQTAYTLADAMLKERSKK